MLGNSNQKMDGTVLLQLLSHSPNVQVKNSDTNTIVIKYGEEVILETKFLPNLSVSFPKSPKTEELLEQKTPPDDGANPQEDEDLKKDILLRPRRTAPDAQAPINHSWPSDPDIVQPLVDFLVQKFEPEKLKHICYSIYFLRTSIYKDVKDKKYRTAIAREMVGCLDDRNLLSQLVTYLEEKEPHFYALLKQQNPNISW